MDEVTRELRQYTDDPDPGDVDEDELDRLVWEAMVEGIAESVWRAACEDAGLDLYARTDPDEEPW
jgi:hypothetical protein